MPAEGLAPIIVLHQKPNTQGTSAMRNLQLLARATMQVRLTFLSYSDASALPHPAPGPAPAPAPTQPTLTSSPSTNSSSAWLNIMRLAALRTSVSPYRSFILRSRRPPRRFFCCGIKGGREADRGGA